jgi:chromosome segregation protein
MMTEEKTLKKQIEKLRLELNKKDGEINEYLEKIEALEDEIMKLEMLIPDKKSKKLSKKDKKTKFAMELELKDKEIRDLKDRMGFLRKEKIDLQKELQTIKDEEDTSSSVMRVEDLRAKAPLNILVKELQDKINKKDSIIRKLKRNSTGEQLDYSELIDEKDNEIKELKEEVSVLSRKLESSTPIDNKKSSKNITKDLLTDLQETLKKVKRQNEDLKKKLDKYEQLTSSDQDEATIFKLNQELNSKNKEISELKELISSIKVSAQQQPQPLDQVVEELQKKLNKAKTRIQLLESQSKDNQLQPSSFNTLTSKAANGKLKIQREMASFLQQKLDEAQKKLNIKEEEIVTIKNEAIRIKKSYENLQNQINHKDQQIIDLKKELQLSSENQAQVVANPKEDQHITLRIEELKSIIEDLKKQNVQQRLEISQLRKST